MSARNILYIEDEEDYQILVQRILGHAGLDVRVAETGREGLLALRKERPDLLILDINLPDTDGYTICRELRQDPAWADLPILMLTVRRRPDEWLRGFSSGANDYVSKPLNPPELLERVVNCLEGKAHQPSGGEEKAEYSLIRAALAGNRAAFEVLIQKYKPRLIENLRPVVQNDTQADDVVAQAFTLAFQKLDQFRGEASFYTWIYRIAYNEFRNSRRRPGMASLDEISGGDEGVLPASTEREDDVEKTLAEKSAGEEARAVLRRVPDPYRDILEMYFLKDMSYEAIAKKLGIPEGTVMSRLFKGRQLLQEAGRSGSDGLVPLER